MIVSGTMVCSLSLGFCTNGVPPIGKRFHGSIGMHRHQVRTVPVLVDLRNYLYRFKARIAACRKFTLPVAASGVFRSISDMCRGYWKLKLDELVAQV